MQRTFTIDPGRAGVRRAEAEERIRAAAHRLLSTSPSYTGLSVGAITAEAGVPRTTFYYYFRDKRQILEALVDDVFARVREVGRRFATGRPAEREVMRRDVSAIVHIWRENAGVLTSIGELAEYDPEARRIYHEFLNGLITLTAEYFRRNDPGTNSTAASPEMIASILMWTMERACQQIAVHQDLDGAAFSDLIEALTDVSWAVLQMFGASPRDDGPR